MAIKTVRAKLNGAWYALTLNSTSGKWEATVTAPSITSYNQAGHYYGIEIEAANTAGTVTTINSTDPTVGASLKLVVKEKVKPTISITSPGSGAYVTNAQQPILFQLLDETNGSGVNIATMQLKVDNGTAITSASSGMVCTKSGNGYDCTYTPPSGFADGSHTVTIDVQDYDENAAVQVARSYIIDTVPPVLNITSPENGMITNTAAVVVAGTTNDATSSPVTVRIKLNNLDQGVVSIESNGAFSKAITLAEGSNTVTVISTDGADRKTTVDINCTLDTTVPRISSVTITPNPVDAGKTVIISVEAVSV